MARELRPLARALHLRHSRTAAGDRWASSRVVLAAVGVGPLTAARGAAGVLDSIKPARVLVVGVAGGIDPRLAVAQVLSPAQVVDARTGARYVPDGPGLDGSTLVTLEVIGAHVPPGTTAVDMETAAIAAQCELRHVPWDVRRAVSDTAGTVTPALGALLGGDGRVAPMAVARLVFAQPQHIPGLLRLGRDTHRAIHAVTAVSLRFLAELVLDEHGG